MITYRISTVRVDTKTEAASEGGGGSSRQQRQPVAPPETAQAPQQYSKDSALGSGGVRPDRRAVGGAIVPLAPGEQPGVSGPQPPEGAGGVVAAPAPAQAARLRGLAGGSRGGSRAASSAGSSGSTTKDAVKSKGSGLVSGRLCSDDARGGCEPTLPAWVHQHMSRFRGAMQNQTLQCCSQSTRGLHTPQPASEFHCRGLCPVACLC